MQRNQPVVGQSKTVRGAFTLVELLMVIAIIGILIGMLAVALGPVITQSREFAVTREMADMDLAIENFNNKYGFYPPSFTGLTSAADVLPYLNKLSPNHRELDPMFTTSTTPTRLGLWWTAVGQRLDDRGSLILWLSGLSKNKQYPLTGGLSPLDSTTLLPDPDGTIAQIPAIFGADLCAHVDSTGANAPGAAEPTILPLGAMSRDILFDFRGGQLSREIATNPAGTRAGIRVYNMPYGNQSGDRAYYYRNAAFYATAPAALNVNTNLGPVFLNPRTFQIATLGLDGQASTFAPSALNTPTVPAPTEAERGQRKFNNDNIANFANGRLDGFDWSEVVELGTADPQ